MSAMIVRRPLIGKHADPAYRQLKRLAMRFLHDRDDRALIRSCRSLNELDCALRDLHVTRRMLDAFELGQELGVCARAAEDSESELDDRLHNAVLTERVRAAMSLVRPPLHDARELTASLRSAFLENNHFLVSGVPTLDLGTSRATQPAIYVRRLEDGSVMQNPACVVDGNWLVCQSTDGGSHFTLAYSGRFSDPFLELPVYVNLKSIVRERVDTPAELDRTIGLHRCGYFWLVNLRMICGYENISRGSDSTRATAMVHTVIV